MPSLSLLALAVSAGLSASPQAPAAVTVQPLAFPSVKASAHAAAIPSPKLTEMRVEIDARGEAHIVCRERENPAYARAMHDARSPARGPAQ